MTEELDRARAEALEEHRSIIELICDRARSLSKSHKAYHLRRLREIEAEFGISSKSYNNTLFSNTKDKE